MFFVVLAVLGMFVVLALVRGRQVAAPVVLFNGSLLVAALFAIAIDEQGVAPIVDFRDETLIVVLVGSCAFTAGTLFVSRATKAARGNSPVFDLDPRRLELAHLTIVSAGGIAWLVAVMGFGSIPVLGFLSGASNIDAVNLAIAETQPALLTGIVVALAKTIAITSSVIASSRLVLQRNEDVSMLTARSSTSRVRLLVFVGAAAVSVMTLYQGKRQGFTEAVLIFLVTWTIAQGGRFPNLLVSWRARQGVRRGSGTGGAVATMAVLAIVSVGLALAFAFEQGARVSFRAVIDPVDFVRFMATAPLVNLDSLVGPAGPSEPFAGAYFLASVVPTRLADALGSFGPNLPLVLDEIKAIALRLPEPSAPATYAGRVFLDFGLLGVAVFSLFIGAASQRAYEIARRRQSGLLIYGVFAWPLAVVLSDNWFYLLPGFFGPLGLVALVAWACRQEPATQGRLHVIQR